MARSQQELLTEIHAAQAELELMAGYEQSYPEHYAELKAELSQAMAEYAQAMQTDTPYTSEPRESTGDPPHTSNGANGSSGKNGNGAKAGPANGSNGKNGNGSKGGKKDLHVAVQDSICIAGRGDTVMLLHWEDEDDAGSSASGGSGGNAAAASPQPTSSQPTSSQPTSSQPTKPQTTNPPKTAEASDKPRAPSPNDTNKPGSPAKPGAASTAPKPAAPAPNKPQGPAEPPPSANTAPPAPQSLKMVKVTADKYKDGYASLQLRSDVAEYYNKVRDEVLSKGGVLTSSGGVRALNAAVGASRSATSFHYTGRALDLHVYSGMVDPKKDPYVVVREQARVYRVYARCSADQAEVTDLSNVMTYHKRNGSLTATGSFFDLTAVFMKHGFNRIRARENFEGGGDQLGAEWWHFQCEIGLVRGTSTFGQDLLSVYSEATLKAQPPWKYKDYVFGKNWN
jgi:hypothetical protein